MVRKTGSGTARPSRASKTGSTPVRAAAGRTAPAPKKPGTTRPPGTVSATRATPPPAAPFPGRRQKKRRGGPAANPGENGGIAAQLLAQIIQSSDAAIIGKTLDGVVTSWNPSAERIFGYTAAEMIGRPIDVIASPQHPKEMKRILARVRRGER